MIKSGLEDFKDEIDTIKADCYSVLDICNKDLMKMKGDNELLLKKF